MRALEISNFYRRHLKFWKFVFQTLYFKIMLKNFRFLLHRHFELKNKPKNGKLFSLRKSFVFVWRRFTQNNYLRQAWWLENIKSCCFIVSRKWNLTRTFRFLIKSQRKSLPRDSWISELFTFQSQLYKVNRPERCSIHTKNNS